MLDIIIPVLNEEAILLRDVEYFRALSKRARLVFADGGSTDRTVELAGRVAEVRVSCAGRAVQKNAGAKGRRAQVMLFLHADTRIDPGSLTAVERAMIQGTVGGCFTIRIEPRRNVFIFFESLLNGRAKKSKAVDGDMGMFVRREVFERLGGFPEFPVMEDIIFSNALRKEGRLVQLSETITVSARKWAEQGFFRTLAQYTRSYLWYWFVYPFTKSYKVTSHKVTTKG